MDWPTFLVSTATAASTLLVGGGLTSLRARKEQRLTYARLDELEKVTWTQRAAIRRHNAHYHTDGDSEVIIADLPGWMGGTGDQA